MTRSPPRRKSSFKTALASLRVKISESKSLISHSGAAEFAKRFLIDCLRKDLSPVTRKSLLGVHLPMCKFALAHKYEVKRFSTFRRLGGAGYKNCSRTIGMGSSNLEVVDSDLWLQLHAPSFEFDFGDGLPLSPSKFWWIIRRFIK